jgi:hypothetical protein
MRAAVLRKIADDRRLNKWQGWLWNQIGPEIVSLHVNRHVWRETHSITAANPGLPPSYWWQFLNDTYGVTVAVALRRQAECNDGRVTTLGRLVLEMSQDASRLSRDFYLTRYGTDDTRLAWARQHWVDEFAGSVGDHLDPGIPAGDLDRITSAVAKVKGFVDRHLAHRDRTAVPAYEQPSLGDAHDAVDVLGAVYRRYMCLMNGLESAVLLPRFDHDWKAVFRSPWTPPKASTTSVLTLTGLPLRSSSSGRDA